MGPDAVAMVEIEMAVLARALEQHRRNSEILRGLDRASYLLARTLAGRGTLSITLLAASLGLDATTVTRQVAAMDAAGLVRRRADATDGRVSLITLTPLGRSKMRAATAARTARITELLADWSERDRAELGRLLGRFNDALTDGRSRLLRG